jgi:hypothetical protein
MAKRHQQRPAEERVGRNNPEKSTVITTGTYKKKETYRKQAEEHKNPGKTPQEAKVPPTRDMHPELTHEGDSRARTVEGEKRSGSDSNANKHRKGSRLHETAEKQPPPHPEGYDFEQDLEANDFAGGNYGLRGPTTVDYGHTADDIKSLHTTLADLTDDELKNIVIVSQGSRLEQGATYIDLRHLEQGEFVATANMVAGPDNLYVPKKDIGYVLWNRLNQVTNPARLDNEV